MGLQKNSKNLFWFLAEGFRCRSLPYNLSIRKICSLFESYSSFGGTKRHDLILVGSFAKSPCCYSVAVCFSVELSLDWGENVLLGFLVWNPKFISQRDIQKAQWHTLITYWSMWISSRDVIPIEFTVRFYLPTIIFLYAKKVPWGTADSLNPLNLLQSSNTIVTISIIIVRNEGDGFSRNKCGQR